MLFFSDSLFLFSPHRKDPSRYRAKKSCFVPHTIMYKSWLDSAESSSAVSYIPGSRSQKCYMGFPCILCEIYANIPLHLVPCCEKSIYSIACCGQSTFSLACCAKYIYSVFPCMLCDFYIFPCMLCKIYKFHYMLWEIYIFYCMLCEICIFLCMLCEIYPYIP